MYTIILTSFCIGVGGRIQKEANILVLQQRQLWILSLGVFDQAMLCNQWLESWLNSVA